MVDTPTFAGAKVAFFFITTNGCTPILQKKLSLLVVRPHWRYLFVMLKIVIDRHIPYASEVLSSVAHVEALLPADITPSAVRDADALLVRTRTRCDASGALDGAFCSHGNNWL